MSDLQRCSGTNTVRAAQINISDGETIGVCLYLSEEDLLALGVDPQQSGVVLYRIDPDAGNLIVSDDVQSETTGNQSTENNSSINR